MAFFTLMSTKMRCQWTPPSFSSVQKFSSQIFPKLPKCERCQDDYDAEDVKCRTWEYFVYLLITVTIPIVGSKRRGVLLGPLEKTIQLLKSNYQCQDIRQFKTFGHSFRLRPESVPKEWLKILP